MRIWSLHPEYLDAAGLVALWREALLAQAVLRGRTKGYVHHPQLQRFREQQHPLGFVAAYLRMVHNEAVARGYHFAAARISRAKISGTLTVTRGQLAFEREHLLEKLKVRDPERYTHLAQVRTLRPHPLFRVVPGPVAEWEKGTGPGRGTTTRRGRRSAES